MSEKQVTLSKTEEAELNNEEKPLQGETVETQSYKSKTFFQKIAHIKDNVTVEPVLAGMIIPSLISRFAMGNLNLDKACRVNYNFGTEICDSLVLKKNSSYAHYEQEVQKLIASIDIWRGVIATLMPCIIIMFLGSWSDRTRKRKICILLPIFGEFLTSISNLINVYFFYEIPVQVTVLLETALPAFTGGWVTMFLGVFAYISDITNEESRTFRVGLVNFCMTVGVPIGLALGGILLSLFGYYTIFTTTALLFFVVLMYGLFVLKEPGEILKQRGLPEPDQRGATDVSFFDLSHVVETVMVAFRPRASNKRGKVILILFIVFIVYGPGMSEHTVMYLYLRNLLNWDMVKFSLYISYSIVLHSIGSLFAITYLSRRLQLDDALLCLISCFSKFVGSIWIAFVKTDAEMLALPWVEILNGMTFTSLRSLVSKLVEKQETAKVNSLFSLIETVASLIFNPLYSWTYMKTLQVLPGTVFLISATLLVPAMIILVSFYIQNKKIARKARKQALDNEEKLNVEKEDKKI